MPGHYVGQQWVNDNGEPGQEDTAAVSNSGGGLGNAANLAFGGGNVYVSGQPAQYGPQGANAAAGRWQGMGGQVSGQFGNLGAQQMSIQGAQIDPGAMSMMQGAAQGNAPSVAQQQQQQGLDAAIQGQMAAANASTGGAQGLAAARGNAATQAGQMQTQAVNQSAALRAQEMAQARGQYGQMATSQAGLQQQQQLSNQQSQLGYNQLGAQQQMGYEQLGAQAYGQQLQSDISQRQMQLQAAEANQQAREQAGGGLLSGAGAAIGALGAMSDERAKTDINQGFGSMGGDVAGGAAQPNAQGLSSGATQAGAGAGEAASGGGGASGILGGAGSVLGSMGKGVSGSGGKPSFLTNVQVPQFQYNTGSIHSGIAQKQEISGSHQDRYAGIQGGGTGTAVTSGMPQDATGMGDAYGDMYSDKEMKQQVHEAGIAKGAVLAAEQKSIPSSKRNLLREEEWMRNEQQENLPGSAKKELGPRGRELYVQQPGSRYEEITPGPKRELVNPQPNQQFVGRNPLQGPSRPPPPRPMPPPPGSVATIQSDEGVKKDVAKQAFAQGVAHAMGTGSVRGGARREFAQYHPEDVDEYTMMSGDTAGWATPEDVARRRAAGKQVSGKDIMQARASEKERAIRERPADEPPWQKTREGLSIPESLAPHAYYWGVESGKHPTKPILRPPLANTWMPREMQNNPRAHDREFTDELWKAHRVISDKDAKEAARKEGFEQATKLYSAAPGQRRVGLADTGPFQHEEAKVLRGQDEPQSHGRWLYDSPTSGQYAVGRTTGHNPRQWTAGPERVSVGRHPLEQRMEPSGAEAQAQPERYQGEVQGFLDSLHGGASYRYKNPADEPATKPTGGRYLGVMAQDVERGPTGEQIVKEGPHGKYLEGNAMLSALGAGVGNLHERMKRIEAMAARKR